MNLLEGIPSRLPEELVETLAAGAGVRIERILSRGHTSPDDLWYDQHEAEFVLLLSGGARLELQGPEAEVSLVATAIAVVGAGIMLVSSTPTPPWLCYPTWIAVPAWLLVGSNALAGGIHFEVEVPEDFTGPIKLKDGRLFAVHRGLVATCSPDGGRTWEEAGPIVDSQRRPFKGNTLRPFGIIRFQSGAIGISYWERVRRQNRLGCQCGYFTKSLDEGTTWSDPVQTTRPNTPSYPTYLIQSPTGRLLLSNEYWYDQAGDRGMGVCTMLYSDDEGQNWNESSESLFVWEVDGALLHGVEVPCVSPTADGRLLMFMRTKVQRIAQSHSDDDGQHWRPVALNDLISSNSEVWLTQIPTTGDLLCVWNQADSEEIRTGFYRGRLTSAISEDSGQSWSHFRTVATSPGMKRVDRIPPSQPPGYLKTGGAVPSKELTAPEGFWMNRFPRVKFIGETAYLVYNHRVYTYPESSPKWNRIYDERRLRVLPIDWFYGKATPGSRRD